ncbi:hypothetical protein ACHAXS_002092 [Conticribra weissflogii]
MLQEMGICIDNQGHPVDYVSVNIKKLPDGYYMFLQLTMIEAILMDLGMSIMCQCLHQNNFMITLHQNQFCEHDKYDFNYQSVMGKINYLAQTSRPDIIFAVHQLARFSQDPHEYYGVAIMHLGINLNHTKHIGIKFKIQSDKGFE